jgi:hypothetical protein
MAKKVEISKVSVVSAVSVVSVLVLLVGLYFSRQGKISTELSERSRQYLEQEVKTSQTEIDNNCFYAFVPFGLEYEKFSQEEDLCLYRATRIGTKDKLAISFEEKKINNLEDHASVNMRLKNARDYYDLNLDLAIINPYKVFKTSTALTAFIHYPSGVVTISFFELPQIEQQRLDFFKEIIKSFELRLY